MVRETTCFHLGKDVEWRTAASLVSESRLNTHVSFTATWGTYCQVHAAVGAHAPRASLPKQGLRAGWHA